MKLSAALLALMIPISPAFLHPQEPTFRSTSSELVVLPVVVTDRHGGFVRDLARDSFTVYDNGRPVPIDLFSSEDTPVTVGLILDASGSMAPKIGEVIAASLAFAKSSNPNDELFAVRFNDNAQIVTGDADAIRADDFPALERALTSIRPIGRTALYDALTLGFDRLNRATRPRKVLILVSDGGDNASRATAQYVLQRARASNVSIYTIGLFDDRDRDRNPGLLKSLAHDSGGERFLPRSPGPLLAACERIAREIRSGYTIGYAPPDRDGAFHRVRVVVTPRDGRRLEVRTRPGYFAANQTALE
jgi:Ca-activated chloride channel family protein